MNANSGYVGYSMSVRAAAAYDNDEKPISKWTKDDILNILSDIYNNELMCKIKKYSLKVLKDVFLTRTSWHHTSNYFNKTDFYSVNEDIDDCDVIDRLNACVSSYKLDDNTKTKDEYKYTRFIYLEWSGSKKHPKATEVEAVGVLANGWIRYFDNQSIKKKNLNTYGVKVLIERSDLKGKTFNNEEKELIKKIRKNI